MTTETVSWTGYTNEKDVRHEAILSKKRFDKLWIRFKKCRNQRKFYFDYVNPHRFKEAQIPHHSKSRFKKIKTP